MKHEMANYTNNDLSAEAKAQLKSGGLLSFMQSDTHEAAMYAGHFTSSYTRVSLAFAFVQLLLILAFSWVFLKINQRQLMSGKFLTITSRGIART